MKKCFTINVLRTKNEISSYQILIKNKIYDAIEIFYPYSQPVNQFNDYTNCINKIRKDYPQVELVLHLPHGVKNGLCLEEHLKENSFQIMEDAALYASKFGVKKLTLHLGKIDEKFSREYYIEKIVPVLKKLCLYVAKFNQIIMIENMPTSLELGYSPEEILTIIKKVDMPNLKFIFDTGHAHVSEFDDQSYIYLLKDYLVHIHYSDNDGTKDSHSPIGTGTIDFKKHFTALKEIKYNELHCMEVIYHTTDDLVNNAKSLDDLYRRSMN